MDVEMLARIQFAVTIGFHFLYPPLSIGLGLFLIILQYNYMKTGEKLWGNLTRFWIKIFALIFAVGVATGIVMEFQFGTNWERYSRFVGDVFGSPLAAEGVFAFFLESTFLGVLLFGWNKVKPRTHFISTIMVALGAHLSAFWIIVANSWMQTPAGYHIVGEGANMRAEITDFWAMVFNPSTIDRYTHTIVAAWLTGAFLFFAINAYYMLKNKHKDMARPSLKIATVIIVIASLLQLATGHSSSVGVAKNQPEKMAAFLGHFETRPAGIHLFGFADAEKEETWAIEIPGFISLLMYGDPSVPVKGLKEFPKENWPPVNLFVYQSYHWMVAIGMFFIAFGFFSLFVWKKYNFERPKWYLWIGVVSFILPQYANQVGWINAEVGRQPWIVYKILRTSEAFSTVVSSGEIWFSLIMFTLIYILMFILFAYILIKKIKQGPEPVSVN